jgi:2-oxoglutarate dehydrogenase E2 component (dihydrolipoamide succinyltransferase)
MKIELKVPEFGESVQQVQIANWKRRQGDQVQRDEELVELETDKATMELAAPAAGIISEILKQTGEVAQIGDVIAVIDDSAVQAKPATATRSASEGAPIATRSVSEDAVSTPAAKPAEQPASHSGSNGGGSHAAVSPAARRELRLHGLQPEDVAASGKRLHGRDVAKFVEQKEQTPPPSPPALPASRNLTEPSRPASEDEVVKPMSLIRRRIAERLVSAQQTAALLTTFNEVDMSAVMELRKRVGENFVKRHGAKLGFMSFFVRATVDALRMIPELNAEIRGTDIVYRKSAHIGIAIGSPRGLVVPILRRAEELSFAGIELAIADFAKRAGEGKLLPDELQGGTFTISNGGVYGSLLSTPIVNPPQSGVLGMHAIEERPVARQGQVVIRPMMYIALTYDHRIVDGREAVTFLKHIKDLVEDPSRMLLEV